MQQLKTKDYVALSICLVIIFTFCSSLFFWHADANAESTLVSSTQPLDPKLDIADGEQLKQDKANERIQLAQAQLALDKKYGELEQRVTAYLQQQTGTYGFCLYIQDEVLGIKVDKFIGYNQDEIFKMASTVKLPVNLYLYNQVAKNQISLNSTLVFTSADYEQGTGSLQYKGPGGKYTFRELAFHSIRESDNVAVNILIRGLGRENISNFMAQAGGHNLPVHGTPLGSPRDLVTYMKAAVEFAQARPDLGNLLLEDLKNTVFQDRIRAGTPKDIVVAHKIGNLGGTVNDIAVVYAKQPYILALMSKNIASDTVAADAEAQVAKMIYESIGR